MAPTSLLIGRGEGGPCELVLARANRHGLVAGATGTCGLARVLRLMPWNRALATA